MKRSAKEILESWRFYDVNFAVVELALQLPQGSLSEIIEGRDALPEETTLLNMVSTFPLLVDVAFEGFKLKQRNEHMKAQDILNQAERHMADRAKTYDNEGGERSMHKTVAVFNTLYDTSLTEEQGWAFMAVLKIVRSTQGAYRADNYEDLTAYASLMGEAACNKEE